MSLLGNPLQNGLLLQQAVLPYTFTTGELDSLKNKLQSAETQIMQSPNKQSMLPMTASEIRTLLRMIDMTYLQGLSGSGHYVQEQAMAPGMNGLLHNPLSQQNQAQALSQQLGLQGLGALNGLNPSAAAAAAMMANPQAMNLQNLQGLQQLQSLQGLSQASAMNGMAGMGGAAMSTGNSGAPSNPPPSNYVCHKCNVMGHWIQECPLNTQQQQDYSKPPPPNYICHRCGVPGHWIKNCPTNGNPTFDNKPHLKVIKTHEGQQQQQGQSQPNQVPQQQQQPGGGAGAAGAAVQGVSVTVDDGSLTRIPKTNVSVAGSATMVSHAQSEGLSHSLSDGGAGSASSTISQPPSKKRRLNQL